MKISEKREVKAFLPTRKAAKFASLAYCQRSHQRHVAETGIERTLRPQKPPGVPLWFPSCLSANHVILICLSFPPLTDFLLGNKLAKAVKYVEYTAQVSGGREADYFQTFHSLREMTPTI